MDAFLVSKTSQHPSITLTKKIQTRACVRIACFVHSRVTSTQRPPMDLGPSNNQVLSPPTPAGVSNRGSGSSIESPRSCWLKITELGLRGLSLVPFTKVPFWHHFFEPQPYVANLSSGIPAKGTLVVWPARWFMQCGDPSVWFARRMLFSQSQAPFGSRGCVGGMTFWSVPRQSSVLAFTVVGKCLGCVCYFCWLCILLLGARKCQNVLLP